MNAFHFWLVLHILGAVAAFGPGFAFPFIGILARKTPGSFVFVAKLGETLGKKLIIPMAGLVLVSGLAMVYVVKINLLKTPYLLAALILYLIALSISIFIQLPTGIALGKMADAPQQPGPPPPEAMALIAKQRVTGMLLLAFFVIILILMVFKPGGITTI